MTCWSLLAIVHCKKCKHQKPTSIIKNINYTRRTHHITCIWAQGFFRSSQYVSQICNINLKDIPQNIPLNIWIFLMLLIIPLQNIDELRLTSKNNLKMLSHNIVIRWLWLRLACSYPTVSWQDLLKPEKIHPFSSNFMYTYVIMKKF